MYQRTTVIGHVGKEPEIVILKTCSRCARSLPTSAFNRRSRSRDGLAPACRECVKLANDHYYYHRGGRDTKRSRYLERRDELLPRLRLRGGKHHGYDPIQGPAHKAVYDAVQSGRLVRHATCEKCGATGKTQAHHINGYDKPNRLNVVWVCRACHDKLDHPQFADALARKEAECIRKS